MKYAFAYGADAVYAGQPRYSLRVRNNDFTHDNLAEGIRIAHEMGKKFLLPATSCRTTPSSRPT
jgi:Collagenase and related proteases